MAGGAVPERAGPRTLPGAAPASFVLLGVVDEELRRPPAGLSPSIYGRSAAVYGCITAVYGFSAAVYGCIAA
eukprot:1835956-Rhodomonas_salina.1